MANSFPTMVSRIVSSAANTNATLAKNGGGYLWTAVGYNAAGATRYLKLYNKASAPTVGTDTPKITVALPPNTAFEIHFDAVEFFTGISYALTTGSADADTGALAADDVLGLNVIFS